MDVARGMGNELLLGLNDYLSVPKGCVYALVCHESKRFVVAYTDHLMGVLYRVSKDLETPKYTGIKNDIEKIRIVVLEVGVQNNKDKKIHIASYVDKYIALGYTQYFPSNLVRYSVHTDITTRGPSDYFVVYLKDKRSNKITVGLFKKKSEMDKFINEYYPGMLCTGIYYANNIHTEIYLRSK